MATHSGLASVVGQIASPAMAIAVCGLPDDWAADLEAAREELEAIELGLIDVGGEA